MADAVMAEVAEKEEGAKKVGESGGEERKKDVKCKGGDGGAGCSDNAAFIAAIQAGDVAAMARTVEGGASVTAGLDEYGATALEFAAHKGQLAAIQWLLAQGADINVKDVHGRTALRAAAISGQLAAMQWLAAQGADIHANDVAGDTALRAAAANVQLAAMQWLVAQGTDINAKNVVAATALHAAVHSGAVASCADLDGNSETMFCASNEVSVNV
jgi:ankyrin repeat protein